MFNRLWLAAGAMGAGVLGLLGCDQQRIDALHEGLSTEADVRAQFGEPVTIWPEADGSRTLEYNRQPMGHQNYMITIGTDGTMSALRQVLTPSVFAQVQVGMGQEQVRRLLGNRPNAWCLSSTRDRLGLALGSTGPPARWCLPSPWPRWPGAALRQQRKTAGRALTMASAMTAAYTYLGIAIVADGGRLGPQGLGGLYPAHAQPDHGGRLRAGVFLLPVAHAQKRFPPAWLTPCGRA